MTKEKLLSALEQNEPSPIFSTHEKALWLTHHDKWEKAHDLIQSEDDSLSSLIHGYLHHVEGDHWNGDYWYRRSGYVLPVDRDEHWDFIVEQVAGQ